MSSPESRRAPVDDPDAIRRPGDAQRIALERLNAALYGRRVATSWDLIAADALCSIAASLVAMYGERRRPADPRAAETVSRNVSALAASQASMIDRLEAQEKSLKAAHARLDAFEDRP